VHIDEADETQSTNATGDSYNSVDDHNNEESLSSKDPAADDDIDPTEIQDLEAGNAESTLCKTSTIGCSSANAKPSKGRTKANAKLPKANAKPSWRNSDAKKIITEAMCDPSS
jgi:hypothetical protein